ncbi:high frequency lysogenization protein HflD [Marinobacter zhejiangensis]|uniref:High frequency lysogenization protein HflD homolog n=1 Tax=Marinobacter zhejiangensis TaxID=488535 RepID=A0A1I4RHA3_9GAMM|nr:high frequency lysogenization protein HflD [Marinobacter zhejiangensis]SFM51605.1 high frequency lysogenization protein [Marinobacter zhejiangensis]
MSRSPEDQALALAGVFQAAALVQQIAHTGRCTNASMETTIKSLFITDPRTTLDVYGELKDLREGLATLVSVFGNEGRKQDIEILRYGLSLIQLESRLHRTPDMMAVLGSRIEQARHTASHFGFSHSNLMSNLASIYSDTISTLKPRIQVVGDPNVLKVDENAARIRALLLAGIRSAVLWRQTGGRRWQLIFTRRKTINTARRLAEQANRSVYD